MYNFLSNKAQRFYEKAIFMVKTKLICQKLKSNMTADFFGKFVSLISFFATMHK